MTERLRACAVGRVLRLPLSLYLTAKQTASRMKREHALAFTFRKERSTGMFSVRRLK